jgi:CubicO group peptidase (beta-lactamase class C family)
VIPVYSISKPFLAQAVLELGVPLDSRISEHVPQLSPTYASRTIGALLNHTSGLADYGFLPEYHAAVEARESAWSRAELLERCLVFPHEFEGFQYSNVGYLLLRMLVEEATGLEYFEALEQLVFDPLQIDAFAKWEEAAEVVPGYDPKWVYSGTFMGDPAKIADALAQLVKHRSETLGLSRGTVAVHQENTGFETPGYGYGLMVDVDSPEDSPRFAGHGGGGPGFGLMALVSTETCIGRLEYSTNDFNQTAAILRLRRY